jgi:hypothetical protein
MLERAELDKNDLALLEEVKLEMGLPQGSLPPSAEWKIETDGREQGGGASPNGSYV